MGIKGRVLLALFTISVCLGNALAAEGPPKIAVLVGVNEYKHADLNRPKALQFAENDVVAMKKVLEGAGYKVHLLQGKDATLDNIRQTLKKARGETADKGVFLVGLAGHGFQPEKSADAYFCPYGTDKRDDAREDEDPWDYQKMLPLAEVLKCFQNSGAGSRILIMDACRNDPIAGRGRGVGTSLKIAEIPNTAVFLSCSQGQKSFEDKAWGGGHGAFFHHVLKGLQGEPSVLNDGKFNLDRLWTYLENEVPKQVRVVAKDPFSGIAPDQEPFRIINGKVDLLIPVGKIATPKEEAKGKTPPAVKGVEAGTFVDPKELLPKTK